MPYKVPGPDDYQGSQDFGLLAEDSYRVLVQDYEIRQGASEVNQYNPKGEMRIRFRLVPIAIDGDEDAVLVDPDGKEVREDKTLMFFMNPYAMGLKPQVSKARKFFSSAMGVPIEQAVTFDTEEDMAKALVNKELVVSVVIKNGKNAIDDVRPVRQRIRKTRDVTKVAEVTPAEIATAIFGDDVERVDETVAL